MSITHAYEVTGMTCGHCVNAVTEELNKLATVESVDVQLNPDGVSIVSVSSTEPVADTAVAAALEEAGDYVLVTA